MEGNTRLRLPISQPGHENDGSLRFAPSINLRTRPIRPRGDSPRCPEICGNVVVLSPRCQIWQGVYCRPVSHRCLGLIVLDNVLTLQNQDVRLLRASSIYRLKRAPRRTHFNYRPSVRSIKSQLSVNYCLSMCSPTRE